MLSTRREMLARAACGFGSLAASGMLASRGEANSDRSSALNPLAAQVPHFAPKAKRVIFLFMQGGPSQVDTFDHKPLLQQRDREKLNFRNARRMAVRQEMVLASPWKFARHGECGQWVSELFPEQAKIVDDLCFLHGMHTEGVAHGPSTLFLHTGATNLIRPSVGSWITYGLGTENENLPGFVTISPPPTKGGPRNYSQAFLPTSFQGTAIGRAGTPIADAGIKHIANRHQTPAAQRRQLDFLQALNRSQRETMASRDEMDATIASFELAFRMQMNAPEVMDLAGESKTTLKSYGIGTKETDDFGRQCLLARRFAEAGSRYIQVNYSDTGATPRFDQHGNLKKHEFHARAVDRPVAALIWDLKQRGLLEDTLIWWGGEFGRTPFSQNGDGRDHNPTGFTVWLAGGGVKSGFAHGETDEFGQNAVGGKVHMHDLHATVLHLLGLNHKRLTYRHAGRDFRLTDVHGRVVDSIIA